ncbi:hypothetical protein Pla175_43690 [Pirellulimonas nuda]|uniref:Mucoidy inhibitor MuiA family protein n=1 Tax=Pirellulimonas nuda TaxID=2528009 RepID=A0A518DHK7_9BACT|nr:mucoidy inhibitor MuiA family protein [Pirellulimonas nuda]QDU90955.1 hypothetical protein Pla175_43690 [Pirellulimonas nuda]
MTRTLTLTLLLLYAFAPNCATAQDDEKVDADRLTDGDVTEVTVYQGQALVTRSVTLPGDQTGLQEVVVTNLPALILPESLYAEPGEGLEIRSVRYRTRPVEQDVRAEVRELDEQLQELRDELSAVEREQKLLADRTKYLNSLEGFTAGTAKNELEHGVLNAETLTSLTELIFSRREQVAAEELELAKSQRGLNEEINLATRKRQNITSGSATTVREAVVFVDAQEAGASLRLRYLVAGAGWSPSYNLRAGADRKQVTVEYNAQVQQMSGEDWTDVAMTLSTATPSLVAEPPKLDPLAIRLGDSPASGGPKVAVGAEEYSRLKRQLDASRDRLSDVRNRLGELNAAVEQAAEPSTAASDGFEAPAFAADLDLPFRQGSFDRSVPQLAQSYGGMAGGAGGNGQGPGQQAAGRPLDRFGYGANGDAGLNYFANESQILDFNARGIVGKAQGSSSVSQPPAEGVSVSYKLAGRTSLPSRSDRQLIQIARLPLQGDFYRLATPVLTGYVYEEAKLTNTGDVVLLAGPASTFLGDEFVGRGAVPTVAAGESFTVGLGIDASLRAGRELVSKEETIQGGNRIVDFVYRLSVENFAGEAAEVRLVDRIPTVAEDDIKITLVDPGKKLADYPDQAAERKLGLLRWDLEAPAGSTGADSAAVEYTLRVEYDKELSIVGMPAKR